MRRARSSPGFLPLPDSWMPRLRLARFWSEAGGARRAKRCAASLARRAQCRMLLQLDRRARSRRQGPVLQCSPRHGWARALPACSARLRCAVRSRRGGCTNRLSGESPPSAGKLPAPAYLFCLRVVLSGLAWAELQLCRFPGTRKCARPRALRWQGWALAVGA